MVLVQGAFAGPNHQPQSDASFDGKKKDACDAKPFEPSFTLCILVDIFHCSVAFQ
jgi:hypothetical protein